MNTNNTTNNYFTWYQSVFDNEIIGITYTYDESAIRRAQIGAQYVDEMGEIINAFID